MTFENTMFASDNERYHPQPQELSPLDTQILDVNDKITKAQDFIKSLEEMQEKSPSVQRQKDIVSAKIDLAEFQTEKQHLLDQKFKNTPSNEDLIRAANDSQIEPIMSGTDEQYISDRLDGDAGKRKFA